MTAALNLLPDRIGHLVITWHDPTDAGHLCQCDCGEYVRRTRAYLLRAKRDNRNVTCSVTCLLRPNQRTAPAAVPEAVVEEFDDADLPTRPLTRGECAGVPRPCPFVSCRHHLYLEVSKKTGSIHLNFAVEPDELTESCSLDVADSGEHFPEVVAGLVGITRQRVEQIENKLLPRLRLNRDLREADRDD